MLWLFEFSNDSPPLFVMVVGKEMLADIGIVSDSLSFASKLSGIFTFKVEVPVPEGGIEILFCMKLICNSLSFPFCSFSRLLLLLT